MPGQSIGKKSDVISRMELANDYFMSKWPDPTVPIVSPDKTRPSNIWTRSTYYEGLLAMYQIKPLAKYYKYAVDWGAFHKWELAWGGTTSTHSDNQCCGQAYIELYQLDPTKTERIAGIKNAIDLIVAGTKVDYWTWIDAIQMSMPIYAKLGVVYNDTKYLNKMFDLYQSSRNLQGDRGFYNQTEHLWYRDKDFDPPYKTPNGMSCYWSRGNGWVFAALARVLDVLPVNDPHRSLYVADFQEMAEALRSVQRQDGFWNASLFDPNDFGGPESSGTAFFVFGMAWGVNHGILDSVAYMPAITKGWLALTEGALHQNGFIGYMQGTGKQPSDSQPVTYSSMPNFEDYGLGAFLLAGSEVYHLASDDVTTINDPQRFSGITVSPNPAMDPCQITITLSDVSMVSARVLDLWGRTVQLWSQTEKCSSELVSFYWDLCDQNGHPVPPGVYLVKVNVGHEVITARIIVR